MTPKSEPEPEPEPELELELAVELTLTHDGVTFSLWTEPDDAGGATGKDHARGRFVLNAPSLRSLRVLATLESLQSVVPLAASTLPFEIRVRHVCVARIDHASQPTPFTENVFGDGLILEWRGVCLAGIRALL